MVSASYVALIGSMVAGVIGLLILWRQCFESHRNLDSAELNEPLIRNGQKRPEEAKSIADRGSVKCDKCAFDNFSHAILCAVCGAALGDASTKTKTTKRMVKQKMPIDATSRGERGVRRGEWTRKSDVEGKFFWFRTAPAGLEGKLQPGFVVRLNGTDAVWVDASTANSLDFPTGTGVVSGVATSAVNVVSKKPFPTKYVDFVERANELAPADYRMRIKFTQSTAEDVYHVTMLQLAALKADDVRAKFVISYVGPDDSVMSSASSVNWQQDWFASICQHLVDEQVGLFTCVNQTDRTYFINPLSDPSSSYLAAGRFIGRALLHGDLMSFHLATPLLKILLGQPLSFHDLEHFDAVTYKSLSTLLSPSTDVSSLSLDFSVQEKQLDGSVLVVDLVPNGRNIAVTNDNKLEYLTRVTQRVLVERVSVQLHDLCVGFYEVVPQDLLLLFDAGELDYLLCGSDEIDIDDWKKHTKYDASLMLHCAMDYLWEFLREMPEDYKRRLLHFSTGSTRVPVGGFAALKAWDGRVAPFTLEGIATVDSKYFMSVPCVNRLIIPRYDIEKESMKNALYNMLEPTAYAAILPPGYDTSI